MRLAYTSDLHGNPEHYARLLRFAVEHAARAIILGGDLFPNSPEPARGLIFQRQFVREVFGPWLQRIRQQFRSLVVYVLLGNEDWASTSDLLDDLANAELLYPLHQRAWSLGANTWLAGSSLVPVTPFVAKDWDRLEGIAPEPPFPVGGGLRSKYGLLRSVRLADLQELPTITDALALLAAQSDPARTIYVFHSPPHATMLDRLADGRSAGSRAVRAFIEQHQPPLTLHGHMPQSPAVSGSYADWIGRTLCINPGQSPEQLHAVAFDTKRPHTTMRHSVFDLLVPANGVGG